MTRLLRVPPPLRMHPRRPLEVLASRPARDAELRVLIRDALPAEVFEHARWRGLYVLVHGALAVLGTAWLATGERPIAWVVPVVLLVANAWASLFWIGQEVGHGAVLASRGLRELALWLAGLPFCLPPRLWHTWHVALHHGSTNVPGRDPGFEPAAPVPSVASAVRVLARLAGGTTARAQRVLWRASGSSGFPPFARHRARLEGLLLMALWGVVAWLAGPRAPVAVVLPLVGANALVGMYALTQHGPCPSRAGGDTLATTRSARVPALLDRLHFHASHHVEHHLFPSLASRHYPLVRDWLLENEPERFRPHPLLGSLARAVAPGAPSAAARAERA